MNCGLYHLVPWPDFTEEEYEEYLEPHSDFIVKEWLEEFEDKHKN